MNKVLEKFLKDARKEDTITVGARQVLSSVESSRLIILSQSVNRETSEKIESLAKKSNVPLVNFDGTSVALGKLCGLQFRISTLSFTSLTDANVKSILKEKEIGEAK